MERVPKAANGRNSPPEKAEYKPAPLTEVMRNCATPRPARSLAILTFDSTTVRSIVPNFPFMSHLFFRSLTLSLTGALALVLAGCDGTDSAQSQYMGGVYGNNPVSASAPQDSVSYWD